MMFRAKPWILWSVTLVFLSSLTPALRGAEAPPDEDALRRKQQEVDQLKRDLEQAQEQLKKLEIENQRLRRQKATRPPAPGTPAKAEATPAAAATATPPVSSLPPLGANEAIDVQELATHFATDPAAAARRYEGKTFGVRGELERFDTTLFLRTFHVVLVVPEGSTGVVGRFNYVGRYRSVYTTERGRKLVGNPEPGQRPLSLETGQTVTLRGRCAGLKDGEVLFTACELLR